MGVMAEPLAVESSPVVATRDFTALMVAEQKRVFLLCHRLLQDREDADSATQDTFLKAYKALQTQHIETADQAKWLTRIAVNTCLDRLRSRRWQFWRRRPAPADETLILSMAASEAPSSEDRTFAGEIQTRLGRALGRLSDRQRAVFTLKHFEDRTLEEIGQSLGLDTGTVKAHMARAVAKLREELRDVYQANQKRGGV